MSPPISSPLHGLLIPRPFRIRRRNQARKGGGRKARRTMRRHLYLVLDDWSFGYAIRKIDLPANGCYAGLQPLPRPIFQLEAPRGLPVYFAASMGSKILAMHPRSGPLLKMARCFDVRSRSLISGPLPDDVPYSPAFAFTAGGDVPESPVFIPVGDRLCALWGSSLQLLKQRKSSDLWYWHKLHDLSFDTSLVTSYAVHPDGQTIFVSVRDRTFCFDVHQRKQRVLKGIFDWTLPFRGRCYFVDELNAWVGLSGSYNKIGRLCACSVVNPDFNSTSLSCKFSKEKVFSNNLAESQVGATLVYLGSKSEFCLLECISAGYSYVYEEPFMPKPYRPLTQLKEQSYHTLLRLTMFSLKFDENRDLTTGNTCRLLYSLPESVTSSCIENPVAFWL